MDTFLSILKSISSAISNFVIWLFIQIWDLAIKPFLAFVIDLFAKAFTANPIANIIFLLIIAGTFYLLAYFQQRKGKGIKLKPFLAMGAATPVFVGIFNGILALFSSGSVTNINVGGSHANVGTGGTVVLGTGNTVGSNNSPISGSTLVNGSGNTVGSNNENTLNSGNSSSTTQNRTNRGSSNSVTIKDSTVTGTTIDQGVTLNGGTGANPAEQVTLRDKAAQRP